MQWSQLQARIQDLMIPEYRKRIRIQKAVYRRSRDQASSRAWITLDGKEIFECNYDKWKKAKGLNSGGDANVNRLPEFDPLHPEKIEADGIYPTDFLSWSLHQYVDSSPRDAIQSPNIVVKAFGMLDQRVGKRTLEEIAVGQNEHPLIKLFHELRVGAGAGTKL